MSARGLQLLNVAFGGTLYQDLQAQVPGAQLHRNATDYDRHYHDILIEPGSRLAALYPGLQHARVNSIHHQGIKDVAPEFQVEAWSIPDHIPEAITRKPGTRKSYIAATQWHPEFQFRNPDASALDDSVLLADFLAACQRAQYRPAMSHSPFQIRDRAARLLRRALLRRH